MSFQLPLSPCVLPCSRPMWSCSSSIGMHVYITTRHWGTGDESSQSHAHFALNMFWIQRITLWYNVVPIVIFGYDFQISSPRPNSCSNFPQSHIIHYQLRHNSSLKFLTLECRYSLPMIILGYDFLNSSTKPNRCSDFPQSHTIHYQLHHNNSSVKFLIVTIHYHMYVLCKNDVCLVL